MTKPKATAEKMPDVLAATIALSVERGVLGDQRRVSTDAVDIKAVHADDDADKDQATNQRLLSLHKKLLTAPELKAVRTLDRDLQQWLFRKCLPSFFRPGIHLVPLALVDEVEARMVAHATQREALVDAFMEAYPSRVAEMRASLGALFRAADYPAPDVARAAFTFTWRYLDLGAPTALQSLDGKLFAAAKARIEAETQAAGLQIRDTLRAGMLELVAHMRERLTGVNKDGRPKVFRDTLVANLREFLDDFPLRNVTNDKQLATLVKKASGLLAGTDAAALRDDATLRGQVAEHMSAMEAALDGMVTSKLRAITFDE